MQEISEAQKKAWGVVLGQTFLDATTPALGSGIPGHMPTQAYIYWGKLRPGNYI